MTTPKSFLGFHFLNPYPENRKLLPQPIDNNGIKSFLWEETLGNLITKPTSLLGIRAFRQETTTWGKGFRGNHS